MTTALNMPVSDAELFFKSALCGSLDADAPLRDDVLQEAERSFRSLTAAALADQLLKDQESFGALADQLKKEALVEKITAKLEKSAAGKLGFWELGVPKLGEIFGSGKAAWEATGDMLKQGLSKKLGKRVREAVLVQDAGQGTALLDDAQAIKSGEAGGLLDALVEAEKQRKKRRVEQVAEEEKKKLAEEEKKVEEWKPKEAFVKEKGPKKDAIEVGDDDVGLKDFLGKLCGGSCYLGVLVGSCSCYRKRGKRKNCRLVIGRSSRKVSRKNVLHRGSH